MPFITVLDLVIKFKEALKEREAFAYKKKFVSHDLSIIDELGYVLFDRDGSELLFNLFLIAQKRNQLF